MAAAHPLIFGAVLFLLKSGALDKEEPYRIVSQTSGTDSLIENPVVVLAKDLSTWTQVWKAHRESAFLAAPAQGARPYVGDQPVVDFKKNAVLGVFGGKSTNIAGFAITETGLDKKKDTIVIRIRAVPFNAPGKVLQNPYILIELPRTPHKMQVQLDQRGLGGQGYQVIGDFGPSKTKD